MQEQRSFLFGKSNLVRLCVPSHLVLGCISGVRVELQQQSETNVTLPQPGAETLRPVPSCSLEPSHTQMGLILNFGTFIVGCTRQDLKGMTADFKVIP